MPRVYIAGPMSGHADFNYPAFNAAAEAWRSNGWDVENPADNGIGAPSDATYAWFIRAGLLQLLECDAIALLPGWETSRGASLECSIARTMGMDEHDALSPCYAKREDVA